MGLASDRETDCNLKQLVLQKTLEEVASRSEDAAAANCCVICLDIVTEPCKAFPCGHYNFDYLCVSNWLFEVPRCPLCKARVVKVVHGPTDAPLTTFFDQKNAATAASSSSSSTIRDSDSSSARTFYTNSSERRARYHCPRSRDRRFRELSRRRPAAVSDAIAVRRNVYRHRLYSQHVGSNRLSRYREVTPHMFCTDTELVSRARMWMRRELGVFSFLSPDDDVDDDNTGGGTSAQPDSSSTSRDEAQRRRRRAINAEFLLEYIVAILKSVDIMGSGGQAEEMLSDFLGRDSTRLFLHELRAWLRSPYTKLEDWDRAVQYDENVSREARSSREGSASRDVSFAEGRGLGRYSGQGVRQKGDFYRPERGERSLRARKEYISGGKKPARRRSRSPR
ncbi:hypothetical protein E4U56_004021 [Claviceps arundinis]|uniref:RING-type E3 ubiquitin transferase n=1 Tax=Claviceps arundinis TaxID=1623583 RepID=A0A9P7MZW2_9HYPO|nr:hypothetical protein E4U56_004021 [Claviceps arundinis]